MSNVTSFPDQAQRPKRYPARAAGWGAVTLAADGIAFWAVLTVGTPLALAFAVILYVVGVAAATLALQDLGL